MDNFAVESVWLEQALEDPLQRHVMVAGNHQQWDVRQAVEELPALLELVTLGPLCQIATRHDGIGGQRLGWFATMPQPPQVRMEVRNVNRICGGFWWTSLFSL